MGPLYLSGGGDKEQTQTFDKLFAQNITKTKPLLYIPIAMNKYSISFESCFEWINNVFNPLGIEEITMWTNLKGKTLADLRAFSAVYIGGGNTFKLLKELQVSGFDSVLYEFVTEGGIVYGGSAGAIIIGSNILTCAHVDSNDVHLSSFEGLSLINEVAIWCHYEASEGFMIKEFIRKTNKPVLALYEETGLILQDGQVTVCGDKPAWEFNLEDKRSMDIGVVMHIPTR
ncbi:Type 1 glutamine amidotransferase-like domain-containing protein [Rossellomorea aquimaris]|uniref:Type 1 glutamine amidotransferase-like domain-containing protein n=1 Tax=Rossellomorea aquimaris TaxID=189382 RepID=UPI0007D06510|nr:Type 1 glutamine amidotransferase-like domain-containing protein [Rossellomorea aquimaris]